MVFEIKDQIAEKVEKIAKEKNTDNKGIMLRALELYFMMNDETKVNENRRVAVIENDTILSRYKLV